MAAQQVPNIYPSLVPNRPPPPQASTGQATTPVHFQNQLDQASRFEMQGLWQQALDIYVNIVDEAVKNKSGNSENQLSETKISSILNRAEAIKLKIEPTKLLLNIPAGVNFIENNTQQIVAIAFLQKEKSGLVLLNSSSGREIYLKDCLVLKRGHNYAIHDSRTGLMTTLVFPENTENQYLDSVESLFRNCSLEFQVTDKISAATQPTIVESGTRTEVPATEPSAPPLDQLKDTTSQTTTDKVALGILKSASLMGSGLNNLSKKAQSSIIEYSENYVQTTTPNEKPTEVSESTLRTLSAAKTGMHYTRVGVGWAAGVIGKGVQIAATKVAESVEDKYLNKDKKDGSLDSVKDPNHETNLDKAFKIGGASLAALGQVWNSLEENLTDVSRTGRIEGVKMVDHKHGEQAAKATDEAARIGIDATKTYFYLDSIGMKAIAKKTATTAGKHVVNNQKALREDKKAAIAAGSKPINQHHRDDYI